MATRVRTGDFDRPDRGPRVRSWDHAKPGHAGPDRRLLRNSSRPVPARPRRRWPSGGPPSPPAGRLHPVPDDVRVSEVNAGGVPAHWLDRAGRGPAAGCCCSCTAGVSSSGRCAATASWPPGWAGQRDAGAVSRVPAGARASVPRRRRRRPGRVALAPHRPGPERGSVAVAGDSAGGGLAVALLVATRDAGEALPAAAVLMSPTVDLTGSGASMTERAGQDPFSTPALLRQFAAGYLAGADPKTPLASPLFAALAGLPPLLSRWARPTCCSAIPSAWPRRRPKPGSTSPWRSARACPTSTRSCSAPPRRPRPPSEIGKFLRARVP